MKKIISLLLVLCTVFTFFACKKEKSVSGIAEIVNNSNPTKIVTKVDYVYGDITLKSSYVTEKDTKDGEQRFDFSYQRMAIPGVDDSSSYIKTVSGVVYQDTVGNRYGDTETEADAPAYLVYDMKLNESRFSSVTVSEDNKNFDAKLPASEAIRVFGTDLAAEGEITVKIQTNGEYLYSIYITYTAAETGAIVVINTSYDYTDINIDLESDSEA